MRIDKEFIKTNVDTNCINEIHGLISKLNLTPEEEQICEEIVCASRCTTYTETLTKRQLSIIRQIAKGSNKTQLAKKFKYATPQATNVILCKIYSATRSFVPYKSRKGKYKILQDWLKTGRGKALLSSAPKKENRGGWRGGRKVKKSKKPISERQKSFKGEQAIFD